nr:MATE family efflux transporter [Holdemania massiliensis]
MTVLCSALIGILMSAYGLLFPDAFARMLGASPELLQGVKDYLQPLHCVALIYILNCTMQVIIRADYNPKLVMCAAVCGNATNILFDWLFVSVFQWGLFGAAAATALGPCVAMSIWIFHYLLKKNTFKFTKSFWDLSLFQRIIKNGAGTFILELSLGCVVIFFNIVLLDVSGQDAVAVFAIISNIAYVGKGIFNGISQAAQPMLSVNYGARKIKRVQATLRTALICALIFSLGCYLLILIFPRPIIGFFINSSDAGLIDHGVWAARIYFISFVFTAVNTVLMYYFQSVESIKVTTMIALMRGLIFILLGLAVFPKFLGELGVWLTITFAEATTLLITLPIRRRLDRMLVSESIE